MPPAPAGVPSDLNLLLVVFFADPPIEIDRDSMWRFFLANGDGHSATSYPCNGHIIDDLKDSRAGRLRPSNPYSVSLPHVAWTLSSAHAELNAAINPYAMIDHNATRYRRQWQALSRLRILHSASAPINFGGDIAFRVNISSSFLHKGD